MLLQEGIGDTIRISLTPEPGASRTQEVIVAQELLQTMGLRAFTPMVTACPGCGRTTSEFFQELAKRVQDHVRAKMPEWKISHPGAENLTLAVMGCVVNGPGRIAPRQHRHLAARHRRSAGRAGVHRRRKDRDPARR